MNWIWIMLQKKKKYFIYSHTKKQYGVSLMCLKIQKMFLKAT